MVLALLANPFRLPLRARRRASRSTPARCSSCELSSSDLFKLEGRYSYTRGLNRRALVALVLAVVPVIPGFLRAAVTPGGQVQDPNVLDWLYTYAWFVTFGLSFVLYLAGRAPQRR